MFAYQRMRIELNGFRLGNLQQSISILNGLKTVVTNFISIGKKPTEGLINPRSCVANNYGHCVFA